MSRFLGKLGHGRTMGKPGFSGPLNPGFPSRARDNPPCPGQPQGARGRVRSRASGPPGSRDYPRQTAFPDRIGQDVGSASHDAGVSVPGVMGRGSMALPRSSGPVPRPQSLETYPEGSLTVTRFLERRVRTRPPSPPSRCAPTHPDRDGHSGRTHGHHPSSEPHRNQP